MTATPKPNMPGASAVPEPDDKTTGMSGQLETESQVTALERERVEVDCVTLESLKGVTTELSERLDTAMINWKSTQDALVDIKSTLTDQRLQYIVLLDKYDAAAQELVRVVAEEQVNANGNLQTRLASLRVRLLESTTDEVRRRRKELGDGPGSTIAAALLLIFIVFICWLCFLFGRAVEAHHPGVRY